MKIFIEIEIFEINIEDQGGYGYYDFDYIVKINGKKRKRENYSNDFSGQSGKEMKRKLEKGGALQCVLEDISEIQDLKLTLINNP